MRLPLFVGWAWRWVESHALVIILLLALLVGVGTPLALRAEQRDREQGLAVLGATNRSEICDAFLQQQAVTRALIDAVLQPSSGGIDLLEPETFNALPATVQAYLRDLAAPDPPDVDTGTLAQRLGTFRDEQLGPDDLPAFCTAPP